MKKLLSILLVLLLSITLFGCGDSNTPTSVTKEYVNSLKETFKEELSKQMSSTTEALGAQETSAVNNFYDLVANFEATYSNEKIDNETATVDVSIKAYSIVTILTKFMTDYLAWALENILASPSKEEQNAKAAEVLNTAVDEAKKEGRTLESTITIYLNKVEGKWTVDEETSKGALALAVIGDLSSLMSELGINK